MAQPWGRLLARLGPMRPQPELSTSPGLRFGVETVRAFSAPLRCPLAKILLKSKWPAGSSRPCGPSESYSWREGLRPKQDLDVGRD